MAELEGGTFLFGECKWRVNSQARLGDYSRLQAKVAGLSEARWQERAAYIVFAVGGFAPELRTLAADPKERLYLISGADLFA